MLDFPANHVANTCPVTWVTCLFHHHWPGLARTFTPFFLKPRVCDLWFWICCLACWLQLVHVDDMSKQTFKTYKNVGWTCWWHWIANVLGFGFNFFHNGDASMRLCWTIQGLDQNGVHGRAPRNHFLVWHGNNIQEVGNDHNAWIKCAPCPPRVLEIMKIKPKEKHTPTPFTKTMLNRFVADS